MNVSLSTIFTLSDNKPRLLTYFAEWIPDNKYYKGSFEKCPAEIEPELQYMINTVALQAYTALNCQVYGSIDIKLVATPIKFRQNPASVRTPAPNIGQHTEEILSEIGYTWEDIAQFKEQGIIT